MALRRIQCREHTGGIFSIQTSRGRQPVRCGGKYPTCDMSDNPDVSYEELAAGRERAERVVAAALPGNPSLTLAKAAKERLTAVGWVCEGRAWFDDEGDNAGITASRDQETLIMWWCRGALREQNYSMEFEKPSDNGYPPNRLHFSPDELSDSELVRMIQGMKVTWWNTLAGSEETAVVGSNVTVTHVYRDGREEDSKRMVTFVGRESGFRTFHVSALLKVG